MASPDPALGHLAPATLGHLWWTLHLAEALCASLPSPSSPAHQELQEALDATAPLRHQILLALQSQVSASLIRRNLWD